MTTLLSVDTQELIREWHDAHASDNLDPVTCEQGAIHDAMHAYLGMGITLEEEELVLNCANLLIGKECQPHLAKRCELLLSMLTTEVLVELATALAYYN